MRRLMVTVAVVGVVMAGCTTWSGTPASGPSGDPGQAVSSLAADCSKLPAEADTLTNLASGATRISLCNEPGFEWAERTAPLDALVQNTQAVVDELNAFEDLLPTMACTADLGPAYRLVVEYPDGSVVNLRGELYGCRAVGDRVLPAARGSEVVLSTFATALHAQRATMPVVGRADEPTCLASNAWVVPDPSEAVAGFACAWGTDGAEPQSFADSDWATLRADILANSEPFDHVAPRPECTMTPGHALVGVNDVNETVVLSPGCDGWIWTGRDAVDRLWTPSEKALAIVNALG